MHRRNGDNKPSLRPGGRPVVEGGNGILTKVNTKKEKKSRKISKKEMRNMEEKEGGEEEKFSEKKCRRKLD